MPFCNSFVGAPLPRRFLARRVSGARYSRRQEDSDSTQKATLVWMCGRRCCGMHGLVLSLQWPYSNLPLCAHQPYFMTLSPWPKLKQVRPVIVNMAGSPPRSSDCKRSLTFPRACQVGQKWTQQVIYSPIRKSCHSWTRHQTVPVDDYCTAITTLDEREKTSHWDNRN